MCFHKLKCVWLNWSEQPEPFKDLFINFWQIYCWTIRLRKTQSFWGFNCILCCMLYLPFLLMSTITEQMRGNLFIHCVYYIFKFMSTSHSSLGSSSAGVWWWSGWCYMVKYGYSSVVAVGRNRKSLYKSRRTLRLILHRWLN